MERRVQREKSEKNTLLSSSHNHSIKVILKIKIKVMKYFYEQIVSKLLRSVIKTYSYHVSLIFAVYSN